MIQIQILPPSYYKCIYFFDFVWSHHELMEFLCHSRIYLIVIIVVSACFSDYFCKSNLISNQMKEQKGQCHLKLCYVQVCAELRYDLSQALLKKDEAERELRDVSTKTGRQIELAAQVVGSHRLLEQFNHLTSWVPVSRVSNIPLRTRSSFIPEITNLLEPEGCLTGPELYDGQPVSYTWVK